jgi:hypothetical protein
MISYPDTVSHKYGTISAGGRNLQINEFVLFGICQLESACATNGEKKDSTGKLWAGQNPLQPTD